MLKTTLGQILVNNALPEDMRDYDRVLTKKDMGKLATELAQKYPEKYRDVMKQLHDVGRQAGYSTNGMSFSLKDIKPTIAAQEIQHRVKMQLRQVLSDPKLDDKGRNLKILELASKAQRELVDRVYDEARANDNPLAHQVAGAAVGNKFSLNSLIGADMQYVDHKNDPIPIPVMRGYGQGLRPVEYFAGAFGTRKGVMDLKCLHEDTQVVMGDWSTKAIKDIRPNDVVIGADTTGLLRPVRVLNVFKNGVRACRRWTFRVGATRNRFVDVVATDDHKILAQIRAGRPGATYAYRAQYTPAPIPLGASRPQKNPTKNEFVAWPARGEVAALLGLRERRAMLLGLLLGDGYIAKKGEITLSCADQALIDDIATYLASLNLYLSPPNGNYSWRLREIVKSPQRRADGGGYGATGNSFKEWLYEHGCRGKKAHEKELPAEVWQWDRDSVCELIAGLIATDGTIEVRKDGCTVKFKTTSRALVEQAQRILELRLGIWCTPLRRVPVETIPLGNHDQWEITFSHPEAVRRFAQLVPLPGVKRHQLAVGLSRLSAQPRSAEIGFKLYAAEDAGECETYDIEVDHPDHLFLLANGLIVSNSATADAGFFSKQLSQMTHRLLVTADDDDNEERNATAHDRGFPTDVDDVDNEGALLARPVGPYKRNTVLTPKILKDIKEMGIKDLLVRSPLVGGPDDGGVYAKDVGYREKGKLPPIGDYVGLAAAQAIGEPITQAQIGSKHSGGVGGAGSISGFKAINALVQVPKKYPGGATHAQLDGHVQEIKEAPQGGYYVQVGGQDHYVPVDQELTVKKGQEIEAGDALTNGMPNPAEIVRHKGIGEGRRYFVQAMRQVLQNSGISPHRRNIELLSRGLVNHVRMTDEHGDYNPDDVVPYSMIERNWQPRQGSAQGVPKSLQGHYLERPVLHYSIGTRLTKNVVNMLDRHGIKNVEAHRMPPPFQPEMVRGMSNISNDPDWMTRMLGSYQQKGLLNSVHRGSTSDTAGSSFVPALARGETFGVTGATSGWRPQP